MLARRYPKLPCCHTRTVVDRRCDAQSYDRSAGPQKEADDRLNLAVYFISASPTSAPSQLINQAQDQHNCHPRCCESTATAKPCWLTSWSTRRSSSCRSRSGSTHACFRPFAGLGLSGERCPDHSSGITPRHRCRRAPSAPACGRA